MSRMSRRHLTLALTVPLLVGLLAGCGSAGGSDEESGAASGEAPARSGEPTERSEQLRTDLTGTCLADSTAEGRQTPELAWLDAAPGASDRDVLQAAVDGAEKDLGLTASMGVRVSGGENTTAGGERTYPSASLSKVPVALAYLTTLRESGQEPTEQDLALIDTALVYSDNDAASQLYGGLGATPLEQQAALQEMDDLLGMDNGAETDLPGLNPTSVDDQLRLLAALQDPPEGLDADDVSTVTELMAVPAPGRQTPDESKDFGVGSLALPLEDPAADDVHVKNGWIADDDSGLWSAGTAGYATVQGTDLEMVVLLEDAPSAECGFSALDAMAHAGMQTAGS